MDDFDFQELDERTQRHAFHIMMLAARMNNKIPWDERLIAKKIQAKSKIHLHKLINISFLEPFDDAENTTTSTSNTVIKGDSTNIAGNPLASSAGIRRVYTEKSRVQESTGEEAASAEERFGPSQLAELWDSNFQKPKGRPTDLTVVRRDNARRRLKRHPEKDYWVDVMDSIKQTPFLRGESDRGWIPTFDFIIRNDENAAKITEGSYGKRDVFPAEAPPEPKCQDCGHLEKIHCEPVPGRINIPKGFRSTKPKVCAVALQAAREGGSGCMCGLEKEEPVKVGRGN